MSEWNSATGDLSTVHVCLSLNIACALVNESVRRHASSHLIKLLRIVEMVGPNEVMMPILMLCQVSIPSLHIDPSNNKNQETLFLLVFLGLKSHDVIVRNMACGLLVDIESKFPSTMRRFFSREEIESTLLRQLVINSNTLDARGLVNGREAIELLHACSACCRSFNMEPTWVCSEWSFSWQTSKRNRDVPNVASILAGHMSLIEKSLSPTHIHIFALSLGLATNLMSIFVRNMRSIPTMREKAIELSLTIIRMIPQGLKIVIGNEKMIRSNSGTELLGGSPKSQKVSNMDFNMLRTCFVRSARI